jgi:hypothetical protein
MFSYRIYFNCTRKDMCTQHVKLFFSSPLALGGIILFISNSNGGLPCEKLPRPIEPPKVKMIRK